ncbi:MAG: aldo/keto reductase [Burkholderiales bacterium]
MLRALNNTGRSVNAIGLGAMPLSIQGRPDEAQAIAVIREFVESGGDFIDTANVYCLDDTDIGHNERLIHRALTRIGKRNAVAIATKGGLRRPKGAWTVDARPEWLRSSCEQSLKDLACGEIFLYQLHAVDANVAFLDSLAELVRLKQEGKILHIGLSNVSVGQLERALRHTVIASVQNRCNPFAKKDLANGIVKLCADKGVAYIPYSPVGGGNGYKRLAAHELFRRLATKYGVSPYCIALAWLLACGQHIIPIPGASRPSSVKDSALAPTVKLEQNDIKQIDRLADV